MKILTLLVLVLCVCTMPTFATDLEGYTFLEISGSDARAVVLTPEGEKQLVSPGDMLGKATVTEINNNRVMIERPGEFGLEVLIVRLQNGRQKVSRIQKIQKKHKVVVSGADLPGKTIAY